MGCIYRQRKSRFFWIRYTDRSGRPQYESTKSTSKEEAKRTLRLREGDIEHGVNVTAKIGRMTFDEAAADLVTDYENKGLRSLDELRRRIKLHLQPFFGRRRMVSITTSDVRAYVGKRLSDRQIVRAAYNLKLKNGTIRRIPAHTREIDRVSNGEINRELTVLKRMFTLAIDAGLLLHKPSIKMLSESAPRAGFFEPEQFESVLGHLPAAVRPVVAFAYLTGWRVQSEVLPLQWRQVDFAAGQVRLDAGTTKNGDGRVFPMDADLRTLLDAQRALTKEYERTHKTIVRWVFHRDSVQIKSFGKVWKSACRAAGCPGRIPHDLRRTAVRSLVRAGIPERVAMTMTGHKTRSVFERYNIVSEGDLRDAARRLNEKGRRLA